YQLVPGNASTHPFFVDASAKFKLLSDGVTKVLVFGLGRGGRAYYGLDITSKTGPKLLWRINNGTTGFSELGQSWSTPVLTQFANNGSPTYVAIFGGGYDPYFDTASNTTANPSGYGRTLFMVNLQTGAQFPFTRPTGMNWAIPSDGLFIDVNGDGIFDRGYIGDMGGNMWRISDSFTATLLFSAPSGHKIFYAPDAVVENGSVNVYFGTGDRSNPMTTNVVDRFYAVRDDGTSNLTESSLVDVTNNVVQPGTPAATALLNQIKSAHGWFIQLGGSGEKVLASPTVFFNVAFSTFTPSTAKCQAGGAAKLYEVDPFLGGPTLDLAGTSGGGLGGGAGSGGGVGSGAGGALIAADRSVAVGNSIPTSIKVTFGDNETKAFFGVTKGGGIGLQPLNLPQMVSNVIPISWRHAW
ncbi:MAG TPA: PilC/PilY family type IV pilus protein, partial [Candidatus Bathyarchaeia archaeon]|nr:PilC/PilY family type IV pilus protein [Candidatus Bathyarchaeia archaeon]